MTADFLEQLTAEVVHRHLHILIAEDFNTDARTLTCVCGHMALWITNEMFEKAPQAEWIWQQRCTQVILSDLNHHNPYQEVPDELQDPG